MPEQLSLFDAPRQIVPRDTHVAKEERPRLTGQNAEILRLLSLGPQMAKTLAGVSLKYTSRVSDLRAAGHKITCERMPSGHTVYTLVRSLLLTAFLLLPSCVSTRAFVTVATRVEGVDVLSTVEIERN